MWKNNDIWNLLPADPKINNTKRDLLPSLSLVKKRFDAKEGSIRSYWELYAGAYPELLDHQLKNALGLSIDEALTLLGRDAIEHAIVKTQLRFGTHTW